jgi:hypothetical protein
VAGNDDQKKRFLASLCKTFGFAAYAVIRQCLDELASVMGVVMAKLMAPRLELRISADGHTVAMTTPLAARLCLASPAPELVCAGLARHDPYLDVIPESWQSADVVVLSTRFRLLAVSLVSWSARLVYVASPQYVLLYFLAEAHRNPDGRDVYLAYYNHLLEILLAADVIFGMSTAPDVLDLYAQSPFGLTVRTLGDINNDSAYIVKMATVVSRTALEPAPVLRLPTNLASYLQGLPENYYPSTARRRPAFDYGACRLFARAGEVSSG